MTLNDPTNPRHLVSLNEIAQLPRDQIESDLREVQSEKARVEREREHLARALNDATITLARLATQEQTLASVLRFHQSVDSGAPGATERLDEIAAFAPIARENNITANVLAIVRQNAGLDVSPQLVQTRFAEIDLDVDIRSIRQSLRRLADRGMIEKHGNVYRANPIAV